MLVSGNRTGEGVDVKIPVIESRTCTSDNSLSSGVVAALGVLLRRVYNEQTVVRDGSLMIEVGVRCAVAVINTAVGGEHSLVVDLERTRVKMLVVCGGSLLDTHEYGYRRRIIPLGMSEILTERRAVVVYEIHVLVSVIRRLDIGKTRESHKKRRVNSDVALAALVILCYDIVANEELCLCEHSRIVKEVSRNVCDVDKSLCINVVAVAVTVVEELTGLKLIGKSTPYNVFYTNVGVLAGRGLEDPSREDIANESCGDIYACTLGSHARLIVVVTNGNVLGVNSAADVLPPGVIVAVNCNCEGEIVTKNHVLARVVCNSTES